VQSPARLSGEEGIAKREKMTMGLLGKLGLDLVKPVSVSE
jgi:hypothetical protein